MSKSFPHVSVAGVAGVELQHHSMDVSMLDKVSRFRVRLELVNCIPINAQTASSGQVALSLV